MADVNSDNSSISSNGDSESLATMADVNSDSNSSISSNGDSESLATMADVNSDNNSSISSNGDSESVGDNIAMLTVTEIDSKDAIVTIKGVTVFNPRDTYSVELHHSVLHFVGQTNEFTIQYCSIVGLFCLPEAYEAQARTFVVIHLDYPVCLGKTSYPHIVMQFETGSEIKSPPYTVIELLGYKFKDKLESPYSGLIHGFFTKTLSALSSTEITRPGVYCKDGVYAVKCKSKADTGILYPLAGCLFFLPEPPTLLHHTEIRYLKLLKKVRESNNDLIVSLMTEHDRDRVFWNIERSDYYTLKEYFSDNKLEIGTDSDGDGSPFDGDPSSSDTDGEQEMDIETEKGSKKSPNHPKPIMTAFQFFSESERENVRKEKPSISLTVIGKKWRNMSAADREPYEAKAQADIKRYIAEIVEYHIQEPDNGFSSKAFPSDFIANSREVGGCSTDNLKEDSDSDDANDRSADQNRVEPGKGKKHPMVAFLCFARADLENMKKENPSATFTDKWRIHDEKWSNMSASEKEHYEAMVQADRQRYSGIIETEND